MAADSIASLLLRITAEGGDATSELERLASAVELLNQQSAKINVSLNTAQAYEQIGELTAAIQAISNMEVNLDVDLNTRGLLRQAAEVQGFLNALSDTTVAVDVETAGAIAKLTALQGALDALGEVEISPRISTESIGQVLASVQRLAQQEPITLKVQVDATDLEAQLARARANASRTVYFYASLSTADAEGKMEEFRQRLEALSKDVKIKIESDCSEIEHCLDEIKRAKEEIGTIDVRFNIDRGELDELLDGLDVAERDVTSQVKIEVSDEELTRAAREMGLLDDNLEITPELGPLDEDAGDAYADEIERQMRERPIRPVFEIGDNNQESLNALLGTLRALREEMDKLGISGADVIDGLGRRGSLSEILDKVTKQVKEIKEGKASEGFSFTFFDLESNLKHVEETLDRLVNELEDPELTNDDLFLKWGGVAFAIDEAQDALAKFEKVSKGVDSGDALDNQDVDKVRAQVDKLAKSLEEAKLEGTELGGFLQQAFKRIQLTLKSDMGRDDILDIQNLLVGIQRGLEDLDDSNFADALKRDIADLIFSLDEFHNKIVAASRRKVQLQPVDDDSDAIVDIGGRAEEAAEKFKKLRDAVEGSMAGDTLSDGVELRAHIQEIIDALDSTVAGEAFKDVSFTFRDLQESAKDIDKTLSDLQNRRLEGLMGRSPDAFEIDEFLKEFNDLANAVNQGRNALDDFQHAQEGVRGSFDVADIDDYTEHFIDDFDGIARGIEELRHDADRLSFDLSSVKTSHLFEGDRPGDDPIEAQQSLEDLLSIIDSIFKNIRRGSNKLDREFNFIPMRDSLLEFQKELEKINTNPSGKIRNWVQGLIEDFSELARRTANLNENLIDADSPEVDIDPEHLAKFKDEMKELLRLAKQGENDFKREAELAKEIGFHEHFFQDLRDVRLGMQDVMDLTGETRNEMERIGVDGDLIDELNRIAGKAAYIRDIFEDMASGKENASDFDFSSFQGDLDLLRDKIEQVASEFDIAKEFDDKNLVGRVRHVGDAMERLRSIMEGEVQTAAIPDPADILNRRDLRNAGQDVERATAELFDKIEALRVKMGEVSKQEIWPPDMTHGLFDLSDGANKLGNRLEHLLTVSGQLKDGLLRSNDVDWPILIDEINGIEAALQNVHWLPGKEDLERDLADIRNQFAETEITLNKFGEVTDRIGIDSFARGGPRDSGLIRVDAAVLDRILTIKSALDEVAITAREMGAQHELFEFKGEPTTLEDSLRRIRDLMVEFGRQEVIDPRRIDDASSELDKLDETMTHLGIEGLRDWSEHAGIDEFVDNMIEAREAFDQLGDILDGIQEGEEIDIGKRFTFDKSIITDTDSVARRLIDKLDELSGEFSDSFENLEHPLTINSIKVLRDRLEEAADAGSNLSIDDFLRDVGILENLSQSISDDLFRSKERFDPEDLTDFKEALRDVSFLARHVQESLTGIDDLPDLSDLEGPRPFDTADLTDAEKDIRKFKQQLERSEGIGDTIFKDERLKEVLKHLERIQAEFSDLAIIEFASDKDFDIDFSRAHDTIEKLKEDLKSLEGGFSPDIGKDIFDNLRKEADRLQLDLHGKVFDDMEMVHPGLRDDIADLFNDLTVLSAGADKAWKEMDNLTASMNAGLGSETQDASRVLQNLNDKLTVAQDAIAHFAANSGDPGFSDLNAELAKMRSHLDRINTGKFDPTILFSMEKQAERLSAQFDDLFNEIKEESQGNTHFNFPDFEKASKDMRDLAAAAALASRNKWDIKDSFDRPNQDLLDALKKKIPGLGGFEGTTDEIDISVPHETFQRIAQLEQELKNVADTLADLNDDEEVASLVKHLERLRNNLHAASGEDTPDPRKFLRVSDGVLKIIEALKTIEDTDWDDSVLDSFLRLERAAEDVGVFLEFKSWGADAQDLDRNSKDLEKTLSSISNLFKNSSWTPETEKLFKDLDRLQEGLKAVNEGDAVEGPFLNFSQIKEIKDAAKELESIDVRKVLGGREGLTLEGDILRAGDQADKLLEKLQFMPDPVADAASEFGKITSGIEDSDKQFEDLAKGISEAQEAARKLKEEQGGGAPPTPPRRPTAQGGTPDEPGRRREIVFNARIDTTQFKKDLAELETQTGNREFVIQVRAEGLSVVRASLAELAAEMEALTARQASIEVNVETTRALAELTAAVTEMRAIAADLDIKLDLKGTNEALVTLQAFLAEARQHSGEPIKLVVEVESNEALSQLAAVAAVAKKLDGMDIDLILGVQSEEIDPEEKIEKVTKALKDVPKDKKTTVEIDAEATLARLKTLYELLTKLEQQRDFLKDESKFNIAGPDMRSAIGARLQGTKAEITQVKREIEQLQLVLGRVTNIHVQARTSPAVAEFLTFQRELKEQASIPIEQEVEIDVDSSGRSGWRQRLVGFFQDSLDELDKFEEAVNDVAEGGGGAFGFLGSVTANLGPFGARLGLVTAGVLGLAVAIGISLVGALASLLSGLALAAVALGAMGVALLAALGPIVAVAIPAFLALGKVLEALQAQEQARLQQEQRQIQADQEAARSAEARRAAAEGLTEANRQLGLATAQAYREMEDAAERASDAILSLERSQLSLDQAQLSTKQAKLDLKEFREEMGLTGEEFDTLFKKFTDVSLDVDTSTLAGLLEGAGGGGLDAQEKLDLEGLVLRVRDARLGEREAIDGVSDSTRELSRANQDNAKFIDKGISASEGYIAALRGVEAAKRAVAQAEQDQKALAAQGKANVLTKRLTREQKILLGVLKQVKKEVKEAFGDATGFVLIGMATAVKTISGSLDDLKPAFNRIGAALGLFFITIAQALTDPKILRAFVNISDSASQMLGSVSRAFGPLLEILLVIAQAAMPELVERMDDLSDSLEDTANNTEKMKSLRDFIKSTFKYLDLAWDATKSLSGALVSFLLDAAPSSKELFKWISKTADGLKEWLDSKDGREEINDFFNDTIPLAEEFVRFVGKLLIFLGRITQAIGPSLGKMFKVFGDLLEIVTELVDALDSNGLLGILLDITLLNFARLGAAGLLGFFAKIIGKGPGLKKVGGFLGTIAGFFGKRIFGKAGIVQWVKGLFGGAAAAELADDAGNAAKKTGGIFSSGFRKAAGSLLKKAGWIGVGISAGKGILSGLSHGSVDAGLRDFASSVTLGLIDSTDDIAEDSLDEITKALKKHFASDDNAIPIVFEVPDDPNFVKDPISGEMVDVSKIGPQAAQSQFDQWLEDLPEKFREPIRRLIEMKDELREFTTDQSLGGIAQLRAETDLLKEKFPELSAAIDAFAAEAKEDFKSVKDELAPERISGDLATQLQLHPGKWKDIVDKAMDEVKKLKPRLRTEAIASIMAMVNTLERNKLLPAGVADKIRESVVDKFVKLKKQSATQARLTREKFIAELRTMVLQSAGLVSAIGQLFGNLATTISGLFSGKLSLSAVNLGAMIVKGIQVGIDKNKKNPVKGILDLAQELISRPKKKFKIGSPSKIFEGYGQSIVEGLNRGLTSQARSLSATLSASVTDPVSSAGSRLSTTERRSTHKGSTTVEQTFEQVDVNVTVPGGGSPEPNYTGTAISRGLAKKGRRP